MVKWNECEKNEQVRITKQNNIKQKNKKIKTFKISLSQKDMKEVKKMEYFAPQVEVLNARVEKGFQMSGDPMATGNGTSETLGNSGEVHGGDDFD